MEKEMLALVDALLKTPCYLMDFLPEQVPADFSGQFFEVESYLLHSPHHAELKSRFVRAILKILCYDHAVMLWGKSIDRPTPSQVEEAIDAVFSCGSGGLTLLFPEELALLVFNWDDLHLSVYNPPEAMQSRLKAIAASEGLFWREAVHEE